MYLGAARGETVYVKKLSVSRPDRALVRARAAQAALELALRLAQGKVPAGTEPLARDAQHSAEALDKLNEVDKQIAKWQDDEAYERTKRLRPDLLNE